MQTLQVRGSVPQDAPLQVLSPSTGLSGYPLLSDWLQVGSSHNAFLMSNNLLEWVPRLRHFIYYYWLIMKDTNQQPGEEVHGAKPRRIVSMGAPVPVELGLVTSCTWMHSLTQKLSRSSC